jgi:outer membrane protein TolC
MMKRILVLFIVGLQAYTAMTQVDTTHLVLTLEQVVQFAREQSPMATMARHQFRESYWEYRTYKAGFLPELSLNAELPNLNRSIESVIQPDGTEQFVSRSLMNNSLDLQLNQNVSLTGGNIFMNSSLQRNDNFGLSSTTSYLSYPVTIGFRQPINGYNEFKWERKIEPAKYEEAKKNYIHTLEQVSNRAVGYFFDLILAQINVEIAKKNYANNDTLYRIAEGRYQLGTIAENELLQMELSYLNAGTALNEAGIDLEVKKFRLRSFLGFNEMVDIELEIPRSIPVLDVNFSRALQEARGNNPDIMQMERQLLEAQQNVEQARSQKGLQADLFALYGLSKNADDLGGVYQDPEDQQRLRVGFEIPILDWGQGRGRYRMAQSAQEVVKTNVQQAQTDFEQEVFLQVMQFNLQDDQLAIAAKADTIADLRYEVTKQRFLIGKIDVLDLKDALEEKDIARRGYVQALRNYWDYFYSLRILTLYDWIEDVKLEQDFDELL